MQTLDPTKVSFTQSSVSYGKAGASYNLDTLVQSMSTDGWVGKPIDVVAMPDGTLASIDNGKILRIDVITKYPIPDSCLKLLSKANDVAGQLSIRIEHKIHPQV